MIRFITVTQEANEYRIYGNVCEWDSGEAVETFARTITIEHPEYIVRVLELATGEWTVYKNGRIIEWVE